MNQKTSKKLEQKIHNLKIVVTDVDGVLTDGGRYYSEKGEILKKFHTLDGMGVNLLLRNGIKTLILTKENSKIVRKWAKDMNVTEIFSNSIYKEKTIQKICKKFKIALNQIAYIGDDVNDLEIMKKIGFSACPKDGVMQIRKIASYICSLNGGNGAFRELVDVIIASKKNNP